jgi:hypothetical protein|eukprot:SAG25_NODE_16_length_24288_cov_31.926950_7_plen_68_part_00
MEPRAAFAEVDEHDCGWLAEADLRRALAIAGIDVTEVRPPALMPPPCSATCESAEMLPLLPCDRQAG